jgi:ferrous iron transport protein B
MKLSELQTSESGIITRVQGIGAFRKRITEMGFVKGKKVKVIKSAPLKDPVEYNIMGYEVTLRRDEASMIEVITEEEALENENILLNGNFNGVFSEDKLRKKAAKQGNIIDVALVGNPNSGKTTLFNYASNSREHVGNYSGVTVDSKTSVLYYKDYQINITDLPGTYSLTAYSPEELYVRKYITEHHPDVIINVVDSSNLERNLYLTTQLIDMDVRSVMALNMYDEFLARKHKFDYKSLGEMIGIPVIPTIGSKGIGIDELFNKIIDIFNDKEKTRRHIHINYGDDVETSIQRLRVKIRESSNQSLLLNYSSRFLAIKMLENDKAAFEVLSNSNNFNEIENLAKKEKKRLELLFGEDSETIITDAKYGFIHGALKETYSGDLETTNSFSYKIDRWLTSKKLGFPIFLLFLWIMFEATFIIGKYPMDWIENGVSALSNFLSVTIPAGSFKHLLIDGIIGGVGGVIVFLPNILILFFFISLMEDSGYMARAAFIMDKLMHKIGLHGKSFIPLIMGFGCNVPAIMATRTIENRKSRLVTMLITPLMSCSARLPVYVLLISAFFPFYSGFVLFSIYLFGIVLACIVAIALKKWVVKGDDVPFVMELPPYRIPTMRNTSRHMWNKARQYLTKMGGVILVASIIIWALGFYPQNINYSKDYNSQITILKKERSTELNKGNTIAATSIDAKIQAITLQKEGERQQNSYAGRIGLAIEPVMQPLGFDWKMSISLLSGLAAKEVVVSTMSVLYQAGPDNEGNTGLIHKLQGQSTPSFNQAGAYSKASALSFMIFILIYSPCIAVIAAIGKESGSWKWASFTIVYTTVLAWICAFAVFKISSLMF